jgi:hypothetical protein
MAVRGVLAWWRVCCCLFVLALFTCAAGAPAGRAADFSHPATLAAGSWGPGAWCWFADPRAVRVSSPRDVTFVAWIDWDGALLVGAYDSATDHRSTAVLGTLFHDDHGNPAILVEPDHRITVFWSAHNGSAMYYRTTLRPEDISAWGAASTVPSSLPGHLGFTYPNPVMLSAEGNRLYLFWRGASWSADDTTRSADGRWGNAAELIANAPQRPYVKVDTNGRDTIAFAFTNAHPRNAPSSIYYMSYRAGWLRHASGALIQLMDGHPVAPRQADVVYSAEASGVRAWVWDVALDRRCVPVIVYATFPTPGNHAYWYARWTGRRWVSHFLTFAGPGISPGTIEIDYSGGLALDHADPSTVFLSRRVHGWFEIERWHTPDGGHRWTHVTVVRTPGADDVRPVVVRGSSSGHPGLLWLHGHYGSYTSYRTTVEYAL